MPLRLVVCLGFLLSGTSFVASQNCYVYQEDELLDSLILRRPEQDTSKLFRIGKTQVGEFNKRHKWGQGECLNSEGLERYRQEMKELERQIVCIESLLISVISSFDSIASATTLRAIQDFQREKKLCLIRSETALYVDESVVDFTNNLRTYFRETGINELVARNYEQWLEKEIAQLGLGEL